MYILINCRTQFGIGATINVLDLNRGGGGGGVGGLHASKINLSPWLPIVFDLNILPIIFYYFPGRISDRNVKLIEFDL